MTNNNDRPGEMISKHEEYDPDTNYEVGDVAYVEAEESSDDVGFDWHKIELKDPPARTGLYWNCQRCGAWYLSTGNYEHDPCVRTIATENEQ